MSDESFSTRADAFVANLMRFVAVCNDLAAEMRARDPQFGVFETREEQRHRELIEELRALREDVAALRSGAQKTRAILQRVTREGEALLTTRA